MPTLDLALGPGMARRGAGVLHLPVREPVGQVAGDVTGPIVREQPRPLHNLRAVAAESRERHRQRVGDVLDLQGQIVVVRGSARECWIPVPFPPPTATALTFSANRSGTRKAAALRDSWEKL